MSTDDYARDNARNAMIESLRALQRGDTTVADALLTYDQGMREARMRGLREAQRQRNVEPSTACPECSGIGVKLYPSTAAWRGGVGGQALTRAVCDQCWGSGSADRPWANLRKLEGELTHLRAKVRRLERDLVRYD